MTGPAVVPPPAPVVDCARCGETHWACVWCARHETKPSGWEQIRLRDDTWATLCTRCAAKRLRNPFNALLPMRKREPLELPT